MTHDDAAILSEKLTNLAHLSSAVGHHVINAYSAIVSNAEILRLTAAAGVSIDPSAVSDLIIRTALDASSVARRLIDYTRPVTQPGAGMVVLHELVTQVVDQKRMYGPTRLSWSAEVLPVPPVRGHADQLSAMLFHLIQNAEDAMSGSGGSVRIATSVDDRGWIAIEIQDTGTGMPPEIVERAVEPFFTTRHGHMGVGLSIANGIWRRHRGTLALRSRPGEGTLARLCIDPNDGGPA